MPLALLEDSQKASLTDHVSHLYSILVWLSLVQRTRSRADTHGWMQELPTSGCACRSFPRAGTSLTQQGASSGGFLADSSALSWPCTGAKAEERVRLCGDEQQQKPQQWKAQLLRNCADRTALEPGCFLMYYHEENKLALSVGGYKSYSHLRCCLTNKANGWLFGCEKVWVCRYRVSYSFAARQEVHSSCTSITQACNSQVILVLSYGILQLTVLGNRQYNFPSFNKFY